MRKLIHLAIILVSMAVLSQCTTRVKTTGTVASEISFAGNNTDEENEDGIREAQEMEFEMTKDVSLGYVPRYRLLRANEELINQRRQSGNPFAKIEALTWTERGPNTDVIGPSNGNTRGTQTAANGVTSGRMRAIWVDLTSSTTVWAGGVSGGLWKSTNISSTSPAVWSLVNDFFANLAVTSICQNPANTNEMYFGTGEKTFNADAVQGGGVWKSTDNGATWNLLPNTTGFVNVSKVLCDAAGNIYAATIGANGIQRSTDGGVNWTNITPTGLISYVTEMKLSSTGRLHIVCGYLNNGTSGYRYTDIPATVAAGTWTSPVTTFPTAYNSELAVGGTGATLYALPSDATDFTPTIYKSTDGGANWAATTTSPPSVGTEPTINAGQGWYDLAIGVDPTNDNNVIAGGLNFYRSTNGGATWTQITRWVGTALNYVHADHHTVVWTSGGVNGQVLVGTDGGIFYSNDNGVSFTDRNDGLRLKQFYSCAIHPSTTNYFIAGAQDNGTHQLTNAGLGGSIEVLGGDGGYTHIDQDEPQYQFSATTRSQYRRSTDGGATWSSVNFSNTIGQFINPTDYDDIGNKMYTSAAAGQYVRWDNPQTGSTFTTISVAAFGGNTARSITVSPYTANRVFFGTAGGRIVRVDNAHTASPTATNITQAGMSTTIVSCVAIGTDDNNLMASFSNYGSIHIWVTTNGGASWTNISGSGLPDIPVRWAMFYPEDNTKAILATEAGIFETNLINGASTVWTQNTNFPFVKTNMLQYRKSDGTVLAATHGRGLWTSTIPLLPYIRFASPYGVNGEATTSTSSCRNYTDYTINMNIDAAPTGSAAVTLNVAGGATATQGVDYDFTTNGNFAAPSNVLTFANGSTTPQPITIRVYNDAEIESAESFTFNYTVSGVTNALAAPSSISYIFTIADNDAAPVAGGSPVTATVGTNNTSLSHPFRAEFTDARTQMVYLASEMTAAGFSAGTVTSIALNVVTKVSTTAFNGFTIKMKNTATSTLTGGGVPFESGAATVFGPVNYSTVAGVNTFTLSPTFVWDGTSNILVDICFDNTVAAGASADLVAGTTGTATEQHDRINGGTGCSLANANFIFGGNARPVLTFTINPSGNPIEITLNNNRSEYVANNGTYYFYNGFNILNSITGASANLGCVTSNIFEAGNTWQAFLTGFRSQKVFDITPTTNSGASYTIGLYFTSAELGAFSGSPGTLRIAKTTAATMAAANAGNTSTVTTNFSAYGGGYLFTATFTGFSKFFLINSNVALPVDVISFSGYLNNDKHTALQWRTANQYNLRNFEIQRSYDGSVFNTIAAVDPIQFPALFQDYNFTDPVIAKAVNYYRLKMVDFDGRFKYSGIIKINNNNALKFAELLQNPVAGNISLLISNRDKENVSAQLYNNSGQLIKKWQLGKAEGNVILPLSNIQLASGVYFLRVQAGNKTETLRTNKQ